MNREEQEFKDMLNKLRQGTKSSLLEYEIREENILLEKENINLKNDNALLSATIREKIKENIDLKFNIEKFMKREAVSFMRLFKDSCNDNTLTDEMQSYINHFIYKLKHATYLCNNR